MCKRDNIPSSQLSSHVRLREPFLPARRLGQKERSLLRGTRRRDRNSSAVPPFLAGLSGSLTQPALCSPDIAGSAPRSSRGTPRPVPSAHPGNSQQLSPSLYGLLPCTIPLLRHVLRINRNLMCILPEFQRFVNHKLFTEIPAHIFLNLLIVCRHTTTDDILTVIVGATNDVT